MDQIKNCLKSSQYCIQSISKLDILLTTILKTNRSSKALVPKTFKADNNKVAKVGNKVDKIFRNLPNSKKSKNNKSGNLTRVLNIKAIRKSMFLTFDTKNAFNRLK